MSPTKEICILGIETSCDETAAAVVKNNNQILSNVVSSQVDIHRDYGGVVPELASRHQVENIDHVISEAMKSAKVSFDQLAAISVTHGPGLVGSLLVGVSTAKAIAYVYKIPLIAINHLEAHIRSAFIENPDLNFPAVALVVSGGHTSLFLLPEEGVYSTLARTRDDAAGEAFDKVAKLLALGYPGGPIIDQLSKKGDPDHIEFPIARMSDGSIDFSFSGLKTSVLRYVQSHKITPQDRESISHIVASFQKAVISTLVEKTFSSAHRERVQSIIVSGGVACNSSLRKIFMDKGKKDGIAVYIPSPELSTDNGAMVATAAFLKYQRKEFSDLTLNADPGLKL